MKWCHLYDRRGRSLLLVPEDLMQEVTGWATQRMPDEYWRTHRTWIRAFRLV